MDVSAYMEEFKVRFARLQSNREKVPMEQLTTKYAAAYNALVKWLEEYAEWVTAEYLKLCAVPIKPEDKVGNEWLAKKSNAILAEERKPGGLYQRIRDSLIEDLNQEEFEMNVWRLWDRLEKEAYDPYLQRYNRWIGKPGNRWIYNSLFDAYWLPDPEYSEGGYWIDVNRKYKRMNYPPKIGADSEGGNQE